MESDFKQANICAYVTDLFMDRVRKGEKWTMFCPAKAKMIVDGVEKRLYGLCGEEFEDLYVRLEKEAIYETRLNLVRINKEIESIEEKDQLQPSYGRRNFGISQENYGKI